MNNPTLLSQLGRTPAQSKNGANHLPARPAYLEAPAPGTLNGEPSSLLLEYWHMLRRRKGSLFLIASLGLLAGVLLTLVQTPVYEARTTLEIQNPNEDFLNMRDVNPTSNDGTAQQQELDLQTQISVLQSDSVLEQVIGDLGLSAKLIAEKRNSRLSAWRKALHLPESKPLAEEDVLRLVRSNFEVSGVANTRLIEVLYDSPDPRLAAAVANALTAAFTRQNLESQWKTSQQTGEWLTRQMEDIRIKLEKSEEELQAYAVSAGLLFTGDEKDNIAETKLRQFQAELSKAQADRVVKQSQYELATTASADSLPAVLDDATLKDYQVKLTDLRRQLAELTSTLTPLHPSVQKVQAQVATLQAARDSERANVTHRIQNEFESAQRREKLLSASYDTQARLVTAQAGKATHYDILKREVDNNRKLYDSLLQHVNEAGVASALHASNVRVIDPARPPLRPHKPNLPINFLLGLLAGGFFGIVMIVLRERADRTIQAPGEAARYLDVPELGVILSVGAALSQSSAYYRHARGAETKEMERENRKIPVELVTWKRRPSAMADSFRSTLASILYIGENGDRPRVIALTSANPREGKTTVASNLALALAEIGRRVLLIDGDLRQPRLHDIFKVSNAWGLTDFLAGTKPPEGSEAMVAGTAYGGLYVLPAGTAASSISNLLHSPRALELLKRMRQEFDMVIIDTPPMLQMPDARLLGRLADGVIMVVRSAKTTKETAAAAGQRLEEDGTRVLGTVLNEWDPRKTSGGIF